jgi:hypothetical protein
MRKILCALITLILYHTNVLAAQETIFKVYQPILIENGLRESITTYVYFTGFPIGTHVELTVKENYIQTDSGVENRNIASRYNFEIEVIQNEFGLPLFEDTVKINLHVPDNFSKVELEYSADHEEVVLKIIECALKNATSYDSVNYLQVEIFGDSIYSHLSKVYKREI